MKAVEAVKENFYCFLGIVHPTVYNTVGEPDYTPPHPTPRIKIQLTIDEKSSQCGELSVVILYSPQIEMIGGWISPKLR